MPPPSSPPNEISADQVNIDTSTTKVLARAAEFGMIEDIIEFVVFLQVRDSGWGNDAPSGIYVAGPCTMTKRAAGDGSRPAPAFRLARLEVQALMDELWGLGFRPTAAKGNAGQLSAIQSHLRDMRALVEKACSVKLPDPAS